MPPLIARLKQLQGGSSAAPRSYAVLLALKVVAAADQARTAPGSPTPVILDNTSGEFLKWWQQESERFLTGDDWTLPSMIQTPITNP